MNSPSDTNGHGVVPVKVHTKPALECPLQKFSTFQSGSQVEAVERRPVASISSSMRETIQRSVETSRKVYETAKSLLTAIKQASMMKTYISLETNLRSDLAMDTAIDEPHVDELEVENLIDIDRHIGFACRYFGMNVGPPAEKSVSVASLRNRIDAQIDFLLDCLRKVDPTWADKMNDCAKDIHLSKVIETLLIDVGNAHRAAADSKAALQASRAKFFTTADTIEKTILWIYQVDQTASKRREQEVERRKNKLGLSPVDLKELHTQLSWFYQAAIELARERRRFIEICNLHLDIVKEVRLQRYDPENVVVRLNRRTPSTGMLVDHATVLFSTFWDELMERITQMRIVADEVRRLADNWKRDKQQCAAIMAECDELAKTKHPRKKALESLKQLLESDRAASKELIETFEAIIGPLQKTTAQLQEQCAQRERAKAEAMKKGAAAAFDPVLDDAVLTEIQKKEDHLQDVLLRRHDARVSRAEALENLQHSLCHKEKELEQLMKNCDNLISELTEIKEEMETAEQDNRNLKEGDGGGGAGASGGNKDGKEPPALPEEEVQEEMKMLQEEAALKNEIKNRKRHLDHLAIERSNTKLKIQCLERQKTIIDAASEEKLKTIREFEKHIADSKRAVDDRRRYKVTDPLPDTHGKQKIEELKASNKCTAEMLNTLLTELEICLKKHADVSTANLQRMDAHRTWCHKNAAKEMEVDWNKLQLRKLECEKGIATKCHLLKTIDEEAISTPIRNVGQSPVILYHELSSPDRANLLKEKTTETREGYEGIYSPTIAHPPRQEERSSWPPGMQTPRSTFYQVREEERSAYPGGMQTPRATFEQFGPGGEEPEIMYTVEETKEVTRRTYTSYHPAGRKKWKTTFGPTGQPQLVSMPSPIVAGRTQDSSPTQFDTRTPQPSGTDDFKKQMVQTAPSDVTTMISVVTERASPKGQEAYPARQEKRESAGTLSHLPSSEPKGEPPGGPTDGPITKEMRKEDDKQKKYPPENMPGGSGTQSKQ
ncbi:hypothetical protein TTRE_0000286101 [Trichuris trichiura]|uniref:Uncharacterized protein n=1 Tax=Trichuris trichiura TaxID=36087 RepID=A0A077Z3I4_TRITR|nr:hypothetical protein TTRE_0000286101 [Trichuris trichiura]